MKYVSAIGMLFFNALFLQSCFAPYIASVEGIEEFDITQASAIERNKSSKQDVINRLGPPLGVARKNGTPIYLPQLAQKGSQRLEPEHFLKKFSSDYDIGDNHVVYYYQHSSMEVAGVAIAGGPGSVSETIAVEKLWILIDERTCQVIDYTMENGK